MKIYHEINHNGCTITCFERDMEWGIDFGMNVDFPTWMTEKWVQDNQPMVRRIAQYTANVLEMELLQNATAFFKKQKERGFTINEQDGVWVFYEPEKSAFIRPFIYQNKMDIVPFIDFNSVNEYGFTLTPGHYSDFIITNKTVGDGLFGYTKDFNASHFGIATAYLLSFCENLENILFKKNMPLEFEELSSHKYVKWSDKGQETTQKIKETIDERCSLNKHKRIDTLIVNKKSVYDLLREHHIQYSFDLRGTRLLKMALALGKPVHQVEKFAKKYIDKKRAS